MRPQHNRNQASTIVRLVETNLFLHYQRLQQPLITTGTEVPQRAVSFPCTQHRPLNRSVRARTTQAIHRLTIVIKVLQQRQSNPLSTRVQPRHQPTAISITRTKPCQSQHLFRVGLIPRRVQAHRIITSHMALSTTEELSRARAPIDGNLYRVQRLTASLLIRQISRTQLSSLLVLQYLQPLLCQLLQRGHRPTRVSKNAAIRSRRSVPSSPRHLWSVATAWQAWIIELRTIRTFEPAY